MDMDVPRTAHNPPEPPDQWLEVRPIITGTTIVAQQQNLQIIELTDNMGRTHEAAVRPVSYHTSYTPSGAVELPSLPAWAVQAEFGNWEIAVDLIIRDMISEFSSVQGDRIRAYCAPLRVSDRVSPGFFWLDEQGLITVNECWAKDRALDSDGDQAFIIWTKSRNAAYFVKYPLTQEVPLLYQQSEKLPDTWEDYQESLEVWKEPRRIGAAKTEAPADDPFNWKVVNMNEVLTEQEIRQNFITVHSAPEIGKKTNAWDARELREAYQAKLPYVRACQHLLKNPGRFYELEGILKANRGGLGAKTVVYDTTVVGKNQWIIDDNCRWRLQGKPGTTDQSVLRSLLKTDWGRQSRLEETLKGLSFLQLSSRRSTGTPAEPVVPRYNQIDRKKRNFTERLELLKVVVWEDLPHVDPSLPPAQILRVYYRKSFKFDPHPVALHDERREGGMHHQWLLPPVCVVKDGQPLWLTARDMLEQEIAGIRTRTKKGDLWPQTHGAIEAWPAKAAQLQQALQRFVGKYGIPSIDSNDFRTMGRYIATRAVTVVYGTNLPDKMWDLIQPLRRWFTDNSEYQLGIMGGVKGSDKPYRRYLIANPQTLVPAVNNHPAFQRCSAKRVGELHSQLAQSIPLGWTAPEFKPRKVRLFIYGDGTRGQLYAFPSGQRAQEIPGVFLPQVNDRPDEDRGVTVARSYRTLSGEERVAFTSEARPTIGVGKLITVHGMKNYCGVESQQVSAMTKHGRMDVDFAISQFELMSGSIIDDEGREWKGKACLEAMLEQGSALKASVLWNGRWVSGRLVEIQMMRTTTASENTRPETRVRCVTGVAKHCVRAALMSSVLDYGRPDTEDWLNWDDRAISLEGEPRLKPRDLRHLTMLQYAGQVIGSRIGACRAPHPSAMVESLFGGIEMEESSDETQVQVPEVTTDHPIHA